MWDAAKLVATVIKVAALLLLLLLVYWLIVSHYRARTDDRKSSADIPEKMVICAHCHLHIPESEAIADSGQYFCCDEHRQIGPD